MNENRAYSQTAGQTCYFSFCYGGTTEYFSKGDNQSLGTSGNAQTVLYQGNDGSWFKNDPKNCVVSEPNPNSCPSFNTTNDQHVSAGRESTTVSKTCQFKFGSYCYGEVVATNYQVVGSGEVLGDNVGGQSQTLFESPVGYFQTQDPENCGTVSFAVTANAGANGIINPDSIQVNENEVAVFSVTPDPGYKISSILGCNGYLTGSQYVTGPITSTCSVAASFEFESVGELPVANAGLDQLVRSEARVSLAGVATDADGSIANIYWQQISGPTVIFDDPYSLTPTFYAPVVEALTSLEFRLDVTDNDGNSASDSIVVNVNVLDDAPSSPELVSINSLSTTNITASWLPSESAVSPANDIVYTVHLSTTSDFIPTGMTAKGQTTGGSSLSIGGLSSNTRYYCKILAQTETSDRSWSNELEVVTAKFDPKIKQNVSYKVLDSNAVSSLVIEPDSLIVKMIPGQTAPAPGDIVTSSENNGFFRKVVSVAVSGDLITLQTENVSMGELFENLRISSNTRMAYVAPENVSAASIVTGVNSASVVAQKKWPESGLSLMQYTNDGGISSAPSPGGLLTASAANNQQIERSQNLQIQGMKALVAPPNKGVQLNVSSKTINDPNSRFVLTKMFVDKVTAPSGKPMPNYQIVDGLDNTLYQHKLQFAWMPREVHVDEKNRPYRVRIIAEAEDRDECGTVSTNNCRQMVVLEVAIYVSWSQPAKEKASFQTSTSSSMTFSGDLEIGFAPTIEFGALIENSQLKEASIVAKANASIDFKAMLTATGNANASGSKTLVERRFVQIYAAGPVPIVVIGDLKIDGEFKANATANLSMTEEYTLNYDVNVGLNYVNGQWVPKTTSSPSYTFKLEGGADVEANAELRLIPQLEVSIYDALSGKLIIEPYIYAEAGVEGEFTYLYQNPVTDFDAMYRFNKLVMGGGVDLKLRADFSIFDYRIAGYPSRNVDEYDEYQPIPKTPVFGIPEMTLSIAEKQEMNDDFPGAILLESTIVDKTIAKLNPFVEGSAQWHIFPDTGNIVMEKGATELGAEQGDLYKTWICLDVSAQEYETTYLDQEYQIRMSGHSTLGNWAQQYADIAIKLPRCELEPIMYWSFDEPNGDVVFDLIGGNDGVLRNGVVRSSSTAVRGGSIRLVPGCDIRDCVDSQIPHVETRLPGPIGLTPRSVELWFFAEPVDTALDYMLFGWGGDPKANAYFGITATVNQANPNKDDLWVWFGPSGYVAQFDLQYAQGWNHVVVTFDGSDQYGIRMFLNGEMLPVENNFYEGIYDPNDPGLNPTGNGAILMGKSTMDTPEWPYFSPWPGLLDEISIYDKPLSARYVSKRYNDLAP